MSATFDIDDLFGDLDDIEQSIEELNAESDFDRHDRLKAVYLDADEAFNDIVRDVARILSKHAAIFGIDPGHYRADDQFCHRAFDWTNSGSVDYWNAERVLLERVANDDMPAFVPEVPEDAQAEVTDALQRRIAAEEQRDHAHAAWLAAMPNFGDGDPDTDSEVEDLSFLTEGCYIKFTNASTKKDRWGYEVGSTEYTGFGEVIAITANNYVVRLDHAEIARQGYRTDRNHFDGKETARLVISQCFGPAGDTKGGRSVQFLWGPTGNAKRAARQAEADAKKEAEAARQRRAVALRDAARGEYEAAKSAAMAQVVALQRVDHDAEQAALEILKAKYAKELTALTKAMAEGIRASLDDYERPAILDNPPSTDWQQYLDKEES